ncbi:MAG: FAD binding domain-containing protein [Chloroflexi bacterium]|nr:FAD binding domain-containing protein [Chloroflexota bacterium]
MRTFEYKAPETIDEAVSLLKEAGGSARPLAGGTDLVVQMKERATRFPYPATIVSLDRVSELRGVDFSEADGLRIGAVAPGIGLPRGRHAQIARERHFGLRPKIGLAGLPAEPAQPPHTIRADGPGRFARYAVHRRIFGTCAFENFVFRNTRQQTDTGQRRRPAQPQPRRQPCRQPCRFHKGSEFQTHDSDRGNAQTIALGPGEIECTFAPQATRAAHLELIAIDEIAGALRIADPRHGADADRRVVGAKEFFGPMAGDTGTGIDVRTQPVGGGGRGRRGNPTAVE